MKKPFTPKNIGLALMVSMLLFVVVKAATGYGISITQFDDSEFPRVQMAMEISNAEGETFLPRDVEVEEDGELNRGPQVLLPKHKAPSKINLHILVDTSGRTSKQANLIRSNLNALMQNLFDLEMAEGVYISTFDGAKQDLFSNDLQGALNNLNNLTFSDEMTQVIDGFGKISQVVTKPKTTDYQRVLLVVNGSDFGDNRADGVSGTKMKEAVKDAIESEYLVFVMGHPLRKIHATRAGNQSAELVDFSHQVYGGYLGGFGADLTSMVKLLKMQSERSYVLQYYSNQSIGSFTGSQVSIKVSATSDGSQIISYSNTPSPESIVIDHLPENELITGEVPPVEVDLSHYGSMVNAVELKYKDEAGNMKALPLIHKRSDSSEDSHRYMIDIPEEALWDEQITYYLSAETPYKSINARSFSIPVNTYNGIELTAQTLLNGGGKRYAVLWTWTVPPEIKAKEYEVWLGDDYLKTTPEKSIEIPIGEDGKECDRYQTVQIKVTMPDGSRSESRPVGYFAEPDADGLINERRGVTLMIDCIIEKEIDTYTKIAANTDGFNPDSNLTMERAGLYLAKIIAEDIWRSIELVSKEGEGYYSMLHYIMIFISRDEYLDHGLDGVPLNESLVYKLISKANHTEDINETYNSALRELVRRIMGSSSV